jgi:hypothetical protein
VKCDGFTGGEQSGGSCHEWWMVQKLEGKFRHKTQPTIVYYGQQNESSQRRRKVMTEMIVRISHF